MKLIIYEKNGEKDSQSKTENKEIYVDAVS